MANFFNNKARAAAAAANATNGTSKTAAAKEKDNTRLQPWVEKYRPKSLDEVTAQDHTVTILQRNLQASNLPHMLFYGPPGTGKTSTILALSKQLFGPALWPTRVLELNASDERGIAIVRSKIKDFARQQLSNPPSAPANYKSLYPCPPYKIIILDEADSMTQDAQSALRRTMETYSRLTRFCLVCNYVTRIIEPLASRCSKFRFKSLASGEVRARVEMIARKEGVRLGAGVGETLVRVCEGDLRRGITFLQSAARLVGGREGGGGERMEVDEDDEEEEEEEEGRGVVTVRDVEEIAGVIPGQVVESLVRAMRPKTKGGVVYEAVAAQVTDIVADGWSATQVVSQLYQEIVFNDTIPDKQKIKIVMVFSEVDKRLADGADEHLSILDLALRIAGIMGGK